MRDVTVTVSLDGAGSYMYIMYSESTHRAFLQLYTHLFIVDTTDSEIPDIQQRL